MFPLKAKTEALLVFIQFKTQVEKQFERSIKTLHTNSGGEYKIFQNYVKQNGITHLFKCLYTFAQTGRSKRKDRHITKTSLSVLAQAKSPLEF